MTMVPNILRADNYYIKISKSDNDMFIFDYQEGYNKDDKDHVEAFQNIEQIKNFHEQSLSAYGKASVDFDAENMTISLKMIAPFEKLANFISMEFLMCGSLGSVTLLDFVSMAASSIVSNVTLNGDDCIEENDKNCKDMYA